MERVFINAITNEVTIVPFTQEEIEQTQVIELEAAWVSLRSERDKRLVESDAYVLPDRWATYDDSKKAEWAAYRQALRDLPANTTDPFNPVWPVKPE